MKVYVVTKGEYSDYGIEAIFTDKKKAELYCAINKDSYDNPQIEEYEADNVQVEGEVYRAIKFYCHLEWGDIDTVEMIYDTNPIEEKIESNRYPSGFWHEFTIPVNKYMKYGQMRKIAQDRWNKFRAEQEGI